jgi:RepB DNA-primase from phage plasmid
VSAPDLSLAGAFLEALAGSPDAPMTWQTFSDVKDPKAKRDPLARWLHGTLVQHAAELTRLNARGAGIFLMVNAGDGKGRETENVTRIRAFFTDQDGPQKRAFALPPSFIVHTSPGKYQAYWKAADRDVPLEDFTPTQKRLAAFYGSDPAVTDLPRVMRVPGFYHRKKEPVLVGLETVRP